MWLGKPYHPGADREASSASYSLIVQVNKLGPRERQALAELDAVGTAGLHLPSRIHFPASGRAESQECRAESSLYGPWLKLPSCLSPHTCPRELLAANDCSTQRAVRPLGKSGHLRAVTGRRLHHTSAASSACSCFLHGPCPHLH